MRVPGGQPVYVVPVCQIHCLQVAATPCPRGRPRSSRRPQIKSFEAVAAPGDRSTAPSDVATAELRPIHFTTSITIAGLVAAGPLALAGIAEATGDPADQTIKELQDQGYHVQVNSTQRGNLPLSQCIATGVHGIPRGGVDPHFVTVYVDVSCPHGGGD